MINARDELIEAIKGKGPIKCAIIERSNSCYEYEKVVLKLNYSINEYINFLNNLNYTYDNGYGMQELYGTIWFTNGTWLSRYEYDGAEQWAHNKLPEVPLDCI